MKSLVSNQRLNGFIVSNIVALAIIGITKYVVPLDGGTVFIYSEFIIIPLVIGIISAWFWRDLNLTGGHLIKYSTINTFCSILLSAVFLREGVICLIIVSPLLWTFITIGAFLGRSIFRKNNKTLN